MSVQFGRWNFEGKPTDERLLAKVRDMIAPFGPDGEGSYVKDGLCILHRAFRTTPESLRDTQPYVSSTGIVVLWDGRLDNREDLVRALGDRLTLRDSDVSLVATAYDRWGENCFARFVGDWSTAIWEPSTHSLTLAKDFLGARPLYYSVEKNEITWSTHLDPIVLTHQGSLSLDEEYIAGWFTRFPAAHLTPFLGIKSVPPCSYVVFDQRGSRRATYWRPAPIKKIRYREDREYEEHFRTVFAESVRRRLRSDHPILAELSGGMDSSSIVCMADRLIAEGRASIPGLGTISYFDDSETTWNERPFVARVEQVRGREGLHIDVGRHRAFPGVTGERRFLATPGAAARANEAARLIDQHLAASGVRVLLSGLGGDELLGGVNTGVPGLADLLAELRLARFVREAAAWAIVQRKPLYRIVRETLSAFLPVSLGPSHADSLPWLELGFLRRQAFALSGYQKRLRVLGPRPSFQCNLDALDGVRRQLACQFAPHPSYERRFPYLDRDLWEFVCAIPREQILRPGERRSLMRRALARIVPEEILHRRRKAFVARAPFAAIRENWSSSLAAAENMVSGSIGIVNETEFAQALRRIGTGAESSALPILRTLLLESWLRNVCDHVHCRGSNVGRAGKAMTSEAAAIDAAEAVIP